jgi:metaxin
MTHYSRLFTMSQAYLKFSKINFQIASANNHASPSGALPFIIPASPEPYTHIQPVPSGKLQRWAMNNSKKAIEEPGDLRYEAYLALLDHRIRRAWVCLTVVDEGSTH